MNLFSCYSAVDPNINPNTPQGVADHIQFNETIQEWQFFWRGDEEKAEDVFSRLNELGFIPTFVERLK